MCDRDNCVRYEKHFITATFEQNSISDTVCASSYLLLAATSHKPDSDSKRETEKERMREREARKENMRITWSWKRRSNRAAVLWDLLCALCRLSELHDGSPCLLHAPVTFPIAYLQFCHSHTICFKCQVIQP